eukprot:scaffold25258_cov184-Skeletonema_dohrnii-CCMP3373.AAC.7
MAKPKHHQCQYVNTIASDIEHFRTTECVGTGGSAPAVHTDAVRRVSKQCSKSASRKVPRTIRRCGWVQATAMSMLLLSTYVTSVICSEIDTDHSTLVSSFANKASGMLQDLFGSSDGGQEAHQNQVEEEPTQEDMLRMMKGEEEEHGLHGQEENQRRERVARNRQIRIEADEERKRMVQEQRRAAEEEDRLRKERVARERQARIDAQEEKRRMGQDRILHGDEAMIPQIEEQETDTEVSEDEDQPRHVRRVAQLYTFAY